MLLKNKNQIIVTCNCKCGTSFLFTKEDGLIWTSSLSSNFYSRQRNLKGILIEKKEKLERLFKGKKIHIAEIVMTEKELEEFLKELEKLNKIKSDKIDEQAVDEPMSTLYLECLNDLDERYYILSFKSKMTLKDVITNKEHRYYESCFTEEEIEKFLKKAKRYIKKYKGGIFS